MRLQKVDGTANMYRLDGIVDDYEIPNRIKWAIEHLGGCSIEVVREKDDDGDIEVVGCTFISRNEITQESLERAIACDYEIHKLKEEVEKLTKQVMPHIPFGGFWSAFHYVAEPENNSTLVERVAALEAKKWWKK